jgi:hypothetical protein
VRKAAVPASIEIRRELARLAGSKRTRQTAFTEEFPTDWRPLQVRNPRTATYFTEPGAREFIVELITTGHPIEVVILERPEGKKGYVLITAGCQGSPDIYIKLQLGSGVVRGRSFHPSSKG